MIEVPLYRVSGTSPRETGSSMGVPGAAGALDGSGGRESSRIRSHRWFDPTNRSIQPLVQYNRWFDLGFGYQVSGIGFGFRVSGFGYRVSGINLSARDGELDGRSRDARRARRIRASGTGVPGS